MNDLKYIPSRQRGFTIAELMIALLLLGILAAMAAPSFRGAAGRAAIRAASTDLVMAVNSARAQAVGSRAVVTLKATDNTDWSNGWTLDYPADVQEKDQLFTPKGGIALVEAGSITTVDFLPTGLLSTDLSFTICNSNMTNEPGRQITISRVGRITNTEYTSC